ncbi:MAG: response regulator of citrate/malate metabolism [Candidatus Azotimanducaceae bacterium]|jgi:response regulator of citrate/malate metabolism
MNRQKNILVFRGDAEFLKTMESDLSSSYQISTCDSQSTCLDSVEEGSPSLLLLDTSLSSECAYSICKEVKDKHPKMDIILLSESSSTEDIVQAYNSGASDYLVKPIFMQELGAKLTRLLCSQTKLILSEEASRDAQIVAFSAMTDSSQLGRVLEFMDNNINCKDINEVASSVLETCEALSLQATVYVKTAHKIAVVSSGGDSQPIETVLIEKVRGQNRIIDFNQRTLYSDKGVSILIKNMPLDNPVEYGRLKDSLMTLACGANSRVSAIVNEDLLIASRDSVTKALGEIENSIGSQANLATNVMHDFMTDMESTILVLGLSEEQEDYIMSLIDNHLQGVVKLVSSATHTKTILSSALAEMQ